MRIFVQMLQIQQPSLHSILEVMNILNGIIFISLPSLVNDNRFIHYCKE